MRGSLTAHSARRSRTGNTSSFAGSSSWLSNKVSRGSQNRGANKRRREGLWEKMKGNEGSIGVVLLDTDTRTWTLLERDRGDHGPCEEEARSKNDNDFCCAPSCLTSTTDLTNARGSNFQPTICCMLPQAIILTC